MNLENVPHYNGTQNLLEFTIVWCLYGLGSVLGVIHLETLNELVKEILQNTAFVLSIAVAVINLRKQLKGFKFKHPLKKNKK